MFEELGHRLQAWPGFAQVAHASQTGSPYRSARAQAWRNMLTVAVNSGIAQGLFTLEADGSRWKLQLGATGNNRSWGL